MNIFANKYTIENGKLVITHTKTEEEFKEELWEAIHKWLTTKDSDLSDFIRTH